MNTNKTLTISMVLVAGLGAGCGADAELNTLAPDGYEWADAEDVIGDWELDKTMYQITQSNKSYVVCQVEVGGVAYIGAEGEVMVGVIEMYDCEGDIKRNTYQEILVLEEDDKGAFRMSGAPGAAGNDMVCLLLEEDLMRCQMPSPFGDHLWTHDWVRVD